MDNPITRLEVAFYPAFLPGNNRDYTKRDRTKLLLSQPRYFYELLSFEHHPQHDTKKTQLVKLNKISFLTRSNFNLFNQQAIDKSVANVLLSKYELGSQVQHQRLLELVRSRLDVDELLKQYLQRSFGR